MPFSWAELGVLGVLAAWAIVPIIPLILRPLVHGGVYTGVTGIDPYDEFQYLAWIREMGTHVLSANLFGMTGGRHIFWQPMWAVSGALWRLGLPLQAAYLLWVPVVVFALWLGFVRLARRFGETPPRALAILVLGLFFSSPLAFPMLPATRWVALMLPGLTDGSVALQPWFALHTSLAIALMPMVLLGCERLLSARDPGVWRSRTAWWSAAGAALVSWAHSWQGAALLAVIVVVPLTRRPRRGDLALALPVLACALPLAYQYLLTRHDAAWIIAERMNNRPDLVVFSPQLAVLGPLVAGALFGLMRRRPRNEGDWMLVLWPLGAAAVYRFDPSFPPHALQGVSLPLAALAVRGWPARRAASALGLVAIAALTLPGLVGFARGLPGAVRGNRPLFFQTADEHAALGFLATDSRSGAVIAPLPLALEVPAFTDRAVWDGHQTWVPDPTRPAQAEAFFAGAMTPAQSRSFVLGIRVRWVLADCPGADWLARIAPVVRSQHRFGCVDVVELKTSAGA